MVIISSACNGLGMWRDEKYTGLQNICGKLMKRPLGSEGDGRRVGGGWN
jgi:hypothetical protein